MMMIMIWGGAIKFRVGCDYFWERLEMVILGDANLISGVRRNGLRSLQMMIMNAWGLQLFWGET